MSEKTVSQMEEGSLQQQQRPQDDNQPAWWERFWTPYARLWKFLCFVAAYLQGNALHQWAYVHAPKAQHDRWNELLARWTGGGNLVTWVKLFLGIAGEGKTKWAALDALKHNIVIFVLTMGVFWLYAHWYYCWNRGDRYQAHFVTIGGLAGLFVGVPCLAELGVGYFISIFCVVPQAVIWALLVSDVFHLIRPAASKRVVNETPNDEKAGFLQ